MSKTVRDPREFPMLYWVVALLAAFLAALLFVPGAFGQTKAPGIGWTPPAGSSSCLFTNHGGVGAKVCYPMDLSANPASGIVWNAEAALRRYGPCFNYFLGECADTSRPHYLSTDPLHEPTMGIYLRSICAKNFFGTAATHDCAETNLETLDYFAVYPAEAARVRDFARSGRDVRQLPPPGAGPAPPPPPLPSGCRNGRMDPGEYCSCQAGEPNCTACPEDLRLFGFCKDEPTPPPPPDPIAWNDGECADSERSACDTDCPGVVLPPPVCEPASIVVPPEIAASVERLLAAGEWRITGRLCGSRPSLTSQMRAVLAWIRSLE